MYKLTLEEKKQIIANHVESIMETLGMDLTGDMENTPNRVAKMYVDEVFVNVNNSGIEDLIKLMTTFPAKNNNPVIIKNIPFHSMCSHHLMPFSGLVTVEYIPNNYIIGLSKIPRVVKYFSKKPQVQENLTQEIGEFLVDIIEPKTLTVTLHEVKHTCVSVRGVESECEVETYFEYNEPQDDLSSLSNLLRRD